MPKIDDLDRITEDVFGSKDDPRKRKLRECFHYYSVQFSVLTNRGNKPKHKLKVKKHVPISVPGIQPLPAAKTAAEDENDIVVRIALDLVQLDINEALAEATGSRAKESKPTEKEESKPNVEQEKVAEEEGLSIVQAVASGLELKPAEDGGVTKDQSVEFRLALVKDSDLFSVSYFQIAFTWSFKLDERVGLLDIYSCGSSRRFSNRGGSTFTRQHVSTVVPALNQRGDQIPNPDGISHE